MKHLFIASAAVLLSCMPTAAEFEQSGPDHAAAAAAGYHLVPFEGHQSREKEQLERDVVGPLLDAMGVERPWGFSWAVTGATNGAELFVVLKGAADEINQDGGVMILGMILTEEGWDWRWIGYGLDLGVKPGAIATIGESGIVEYHWNGETFVRRQ